MNKHASWTTYTLMITFCFLVAIGLLEGYVNLRMGLFPFWPKAQWGEWSLAWYADAPWLSVFIGLMGCVALRKNTCIVESKVHPESHAKHSDKPTDSSSEHPSIFDQEEPHPLLWFSLPALVRKGYHLWLHVWPMLIGIGLAVVMGTGTSWMSAARQASSDTTAFTLQIQALAWRFDLPNPDEVIEHQGLLNEGTHTRQMAAWSSRYLADDHHPWRGAWLDHDGQVCQEVRARMTDWGQGPLTPFVASMQAQQWVLSYQHGCATMSEVMAARENLKNHATWRTRAERMFPWWFDEGRLGMLDTFTLGTSQWCTWHQAIPAQYRPRWPESWSLQNPCKAGSSQP